MGRIRIWKDELERLSEYSTSVPTGACTGKTWKRRKSVVTDEWFVCQCGTRYADGTIGVHYFDVVLLQGPRRGNEPLRFKTQCTREELRG